jgi:DNA-binding response OmpR family regulator/nitrogen-specific signal transduction histidine kinase
LVIFVLAVLYIVYSYRKKIRLEYLLSAEQHKHEQEQLLNEERMRFFTNITHELRTPLTLIIGPLLDMSESIDIPVKEKHRLHIILNSAERLRKLITQILEFRKTETDMRELSVTRGNIVKAVENITRKYIELNQNHKLQIRFEAPESDIEAYFDRDMLAIIVDNLMSNAIKYTERGSVISRVARRREGNQHLIDIIVADTGYGIAESALPHIFERFYQENGKHQASGTGIGLSLVKKLVTLHEGTIRVESSVEKGSTFTVTLNENNIYPSAIHGVEPAVMLEDKTNRDSSADTDKKRDKAIETDETILVIEDNASIRQYIADSLSDRFKVYQAADGREGLAKALDLIPTIVISDIMMPAMDGNELCKALKTDMRTSHIPVILLTAKDSNRAKEEGYEAGADSYITKPFSRSLLETRIDNLIAQRKRIIASFSSQSVDKTSSMDEKHKIFMESMNKNDQQFFERFHALIDENMKGTLDMDYLTDKLNMSISSMYRKIKALTGIGTNEYIRHYKMRYAEKLLLENKYTISEIAYEVGFSSLPYFRKCFKEEFGVNPSDYLKKIKS